MAGDGSLDVQGAVYSVLANLNPALAGGRIYDYVKDDVAFPFVRIDGSTSAPADVDGFSGTDEVIQIAVFSQAYGKREIKDLMGQVKEALHNVNLTVANRPTALCWWDGTNLRRDPDGITHQGIMRFRVLSYEAE
ncbi:MAG: DUF3168 domain-containing protein [Pseudomonadota bacterium]